MSPRVPPCDGCIALFLPGPFCEVEAAAGLLEGGWAEAELASSVLEVEVEKALKYLVVDADVAQRSKLLILSF